MSQPPLEVADLIRIACDITRTRAQCLRGLSRLSRRTLLDIFTGFGLFITVFLAFAAVLA
jgi:hypothetical protein